MAVVHLIYTKDGRKVLFWNKDEGLGGIGKATEYKSKVICKRMVNALNHGSTVIYRNLSATEKTLLYAKHKDLLQENKMVLSDGFG